MTKGTKTMIALGLVGATAWGAWTVGRGLLGDDVAAEEQRWLVNQLWIEKVPENDRDTVTQLVLIDQGERMGMVARSSQWRMLAELFKWGLEGPRLSVFFPQDQVKAQLNVRTWRCEGEAPEPFELCLEISDGEDQTVLYSLEEWAIDTDYVGASLDSITASIPNLSTSFARILPDRADLQSVESDVDDFAEVDWLPGR